MKNRQSAFTLVELLITIAIMGILASVLIPGIRGIRQQADATLCQTRLRNLHQGVMNYFADNERYPYAGSYEYRDDDFSPPKYYQHVGWIAWIRNKDVEEDVSDKSKAKYFKYVGCGLDDSEEDVRDSIRFGSLFPYVREDYSCYFCKQFNGGKGKARRTYAMNSFFGARTVPNGIGIGTTELAWASKEASRLALFVELAEGHGTKGTVGFSGNGTKPAKVNLPDDSSWDWQDEGKTQYKENVGCWHKDGKHGHVIFLDGHTERITKSERIREKSEMLGRGGKEDE